MKLQNTIKNITMTALLFIGTAQVLPSHAAMAHDEDAGENAQRRAKRPKRPKLEPELRQALKARFEELSEPEKEQLKALGRSIREQSEELRKEHRKLVRGFVQKLKKLPLNEQIAYVESKSLLELHREGLPFPPRRR
jgi:hypothetical protein